MIEQKVFFLVTTLFYLAHFAFAGNLCLEDFQDLDVPKIRFKQEFISPHIKVENFADDKGNLYLFRVIVGRYRKGHEMGEYTQLEGTYSYSLNPFISEMWSGDPNKQHYVLVAKQNINTDFLGYPATEKGANELTLQTKVGDIAYFDEVKVNVDEENVVFVFTRERYRQIVRSLGNKSFTIPEFIDLLWRNYPPKKDKKPESR